MEKVLITSNGNFLRFNPETEQFYFQKPDGTLLREVTSNEAEALGPKLLYAEVQDLNPHLELPTWKHVWRIQIAVDLSNYEEESCCNGGKYGFATHADIFAAQINGKWTLRCLTHYSTTSEIDYDELNGKFDTTKVVDILNTTNQFENDCMWHYASGDDMMLEQCSEVISLSWLWKIEKSVYDGEIREYTPLTISEKKKLIKNLRRAGVDLREGYEQKLPRNGKYKYWAEKRNK